MSEFVNKNENQNGKKQRKRIPYETFDDVCYEMDHIYGSVVCIAKSDGYYVDRRALEELAKKGVKGAKELKDFIESLGWYYLPYETIDYSNLNKELEEWAEEYSHLSPDEKLRRIAGLCKDMISDTHSDEPVCHINEDIIWVPADTLNWLADNQASCPATLFRYIADLGGNVDNPYYYIKRPSDTDIEDLNDGTFVDAFVNDDE